MNANELRIGNLVEQEFPGYRYPQDATWGQHVIEAKDLAEEEFDKLFRPIPITEEWLRKFGLEHVAGQQIWNDLDMCFCISYNPKRYVGFKLYVNHEYEEGEPFQFVHQLQNLYFALTGEELILAA